MTESRLSTCPAWRELPVEGLVVVELGQFQLFHVEAGEVGVEFERADVVQSGQRVGHPRARQRNVHQEVGLARSLDYHAQLHAFADQFILYPCTFLLF